MSVYVYGDVLLVLNVIVNSVILIITAWFLAIDYKRWRVLVAASLGAIYALWGIVGGWPGFYSPLAKLVVSTLLVLVAFRIASIRALLLAVASFYIVGFLLGGAVVGWLFFLQSNRIIRSNILPSPITWETLMAGTITVYLLAMASLRCLTDRLSRKKILFPITVDYNGQRMEVTALLDTGNQLYTIAGRKPVVLIEQKALEPIFSTIVTDYLRKNAPSDWPVNLESCLDPEWVGRIDLIPYRGVGGSNLLLGFRPDNLSVQTTTSCIQTDAVVIGISSGRLSTSGVYQALLHPAIIKSDTGYEEAAICA